MVRKSCLNNRGESLLWIIAVILIFSLITALVIDFGILYLKTKRVKIANNFAVKSGSLSIEVGENLAEGIFLIEPVQAEINFRDLLSRNLGLDSNLSPTSRSILQSDLKVREFEVINAHPRLLGDITYTSSVLNRSFVIENPTVFAVIQFEYRGILIRRVITVARMSSSNLIQDPSL